VSLRPLARVAACALTGCAAALAPPVPPLAAVEAHAAPRTAPSLERAVLAKVNRARGRRGVRPLRHSSALRRTARRHSLQMLRFDFIAHRSVDGTPMGRRVGRAVSARRVGETIAHVSPRGSRRASRILRAWMASPSHRRQILSRRYARAGVGGRSGALAGRPATVVTMNLASRR
jgi:uncharacterized protein YkwD